jgi:hypothetical protein
VLGCFYYLYRDVVAYIECHIGRQWNLRQTECSVVSDVGRSNDLERRDHVVTHVRRCLHTLSYDSDIDIEER